MSNRKQVLKELNLEGSKIGTIAAVFDNVMKDRACQTFM